MNKNTIVLRRKAFLKGSRQHTFITDNYEIILEDNQKYGTYESDVINTINFSELVASWNCSTSKQSFIEVQIKIQANGKWSQWFSYGKWSDNGNNHGSISNQNDSLGNMNVDVISTQENYHGTALKFKIILVKDNESVKSPKVNLIAITLTPLKENNEVITPGFLNGSVDIEVPVKSQMVVPEIGNRICSPTSVAMLMSYYGLEIETLDVANGCKDNGSDMYGNWSYNMAYAAEQDFECYVMKCNSIEELRDLILEGKPVAASIKTKNKDDLEGSVMAYPSGHLLVVRGFNYKDGESYIIVNDPAAPVVDQVKRQYRINEFNKVWNKYIYVVRSPD